MPLILPRRSLLRYPAGTAPGFDPSHPAYAPLAISAVASGPNFISLNSGVKGTITNTTAAAIDSHIGNAVSLTNSNSNIAFPGPSGSAGGTIAGIFKYVAGAGNNIVLTFSTSGGNSYVDLNGGAGNKLDFNWNGGGATLSGGVSFVAGRKYFVAVSFLQNGSVGASGGIVVAVITDLVTGGVATNSVFGCTNGNLPNGTFYVGYSGGATGVNTLASAMMFTPKFMSLAQLQAFAADPWAFWYPNKPLSLTTGAAADTTTGGARVLQRFNRSKLAYPAGGLPGVDPAHPAARNTIMSGVAVPGRNMINLVHGAPLTYSGVGGTFPQYVMDGEVGPSVTHTANGNQSLQFSMPNATLNAVTCAYIFRPTGSNAFQVLTMTASGFYMALQSLVPIFSQGTDLSSGFTLTSGVPYFLAASGPFGAGAGNFNFVVRRLDTGQVFQSSTATVNAVSDGTTLNIGNVGGSANHPDQVNLAAAMWAPDVSLSMSQLLDWAKDPWSFWYQNKTINLTANPTVSGDGTGTLTGAAGVGTAGTLRGAVDKALAQVVGIGLAGTLSGAVDKSLAQAAGIGTVGSITGADLIGVAQVTGTGVARALTPSVSGFITGAIGTGLAGALTPTDSQGLTGVTGTGVANTGIVPSVAVTLAPASGIGRAGTFSFDGAGSGSLTGAAGVGVAGTITASVLASISQAVGIGIAGSISGSDPFGITGVAGTGVARGITGSVAFTLGAAQGIGTAGSLTVTGANQSGSLTGVSGTGTAGTIIGFSSTASVALPGGNGGSIRPKKPTDFVPIPRKGGYREPKLEDRVDVKKPAPKPAPRPLKFSEPVEAELPPVLEDILRAVLTPEPVRFESDEDAIAFALKAYLEHEDQVRDSIRAAASEIIESIIQDVIDDLETETA